MYILNILDIVHVTRSWVRIETKTQGADPPPLDAAKAGKNLLSK